MYTDPDISFPNLKLIYPFNGNARLIVLNTLNGSVNCKFGNLEAGSYSSYPYFYSTVQNSEFVDIVYIKDQSSYKTANEYSKEGLNWQTWRMKVVLAVGKGKGWGAI